MSLLVPQVLLLPVHAVLAWVYLVLRARVPRAGWRVFDWMILLVAMVAWVATPHWTAVLVNAPPAAIWPLLIATAASFLIFSGVLAVGWVLRTLVGRS